jgi:hypothetical protein
MCFQRIASRGFEIVIILMTLGMCRCVLSDDSKSPGDEVQQILESSWKPAAANYDSAKQHYEHAKAAAPGDVRVPFAMALAAIRNYRLKDAAEYLTQATANGKPLVPIRRTKIYVDVLLKNKQAAASDLKDLVRAMATADAAQADTLETARWLGCVIGYLNGPGKGQIPDDQVAALTAEVADKLKGPLADVFSANVKQIAYQYTQLQQQLAQAHLDAKQRNEAKLEASRKENETALAEATKNRTNDEESYKKLHDTYEQQGPLKRNQLDAAQRQFAQLNTTIIQLQSAINEAQSSNNLLSNQYISQWNEQLNVANASQRRLNAQAADINAWFRKMDSDDRTLSKELKKTQSLEDARTQKSKSLEKATVTDSDASTAALESKVSSITTYADIDLDQEKNRILQTYGLKSK